MFSYRLYGSRDGKGEPENPKVTGLVHKYTKTLLNRDISSKSRHTREKSQNLVAEMECTDCQGKRLNEAALHCKINGFSIGDLCDMELTQLREVLYHITNQTVEVLVQTLIEGLDRMIEIGLPYLHLNRETPSLSGGEAQRLKLAKHLGKRGSIVVMDEPTTGLHMSDIQNLLKLFDLIMSRGNSLVVIEHNLDVIKQADWIIDIGPDGGKNGGEVVFTGTPMEMLRSAKTLTADSLRASCAGQTGDPC